MTPRKSWKLGPSPLGEGPGNGLGELVRGPAVSRSRADSSALRTGGAALAGGVPEFGRAPGGRGRPWLSPLGRRRYPQVPGGLDGVVLEDGQLWLGAEQRLADLGPKLAAHGLALANQGDIDRQSLAGALARAPMARAGPCRPLRPWSRACVWWMRRAGPRAHRPRDLGWHRIHLGLLGVVTALALRLRPAYGLAERNAKVPFEALFEEPCALAASAMVSFGGFPPAMKRSLSSSGDSS